MRALGSLWDRVLGKAEALLWERNERRRVLDPTLVAQIHPASLLFYYGNIHSQRGQDGILGEIFRRVGVQRGRFVEFGAWDGMFLSNCRYLYELGWGGAFIEASPQRFRTLLKHYAVPGHGGFMARGDVRCINSMVGAPQYGVKGEQLGPLLARHNFDPETVAFVSIDVDGPDLEIFLDMGFRPAVVLLEGGFNFAPKYDRRVPNEIAWSNSQQPLAVIVAEAERAGYVPVCFYQDTFLVRADLAGPFERFDAMALYMDAFRFMPVDYRQGLMRARAGSRVVRRLEAEFFGRFSADPLAY